MLLLFDSTTSWASVLAWLPEAPPNTVPLGNVIVWGFCSSGCCTTYCCGWPAHPTSRNIAMAFTTEDALFVVLSFIIYFSLAFIFSTAQHFMRVLKSPDSHH